MSLHRQTNSRSESPERRRSRSPENRRTTELPHGATPISESDYYSRCNEFRVWLKDEKEKYFDELSGEKARSYFRKFVKAWNRGKLPKSLYKGVDNATQAASSLTNYKWSFASKRPRAEQDALTNARHHVAAATNLIKSDVGPESTRNRESRRMQGPTLPSREDIILSRESAAEQQTAERSHQRKRDRAEVKEAVEDMVGPKETGRDGMMEKKRMKREGNNAFKDAKDDGFEEMDDKTLMGGGDSFKARIAQRDAARKRFAEKREAARGEKGTDTRERVESMRQKEKATMDMFKQMAKERFGS